MMKNRRRSSRRIAAPRSRRPFLEGLEDRRLLATALFAIPSGQGAVIAEINPQDGSEVRRFAAPATPTGADGLAYNGESLFYMPGDGSRQLFELNPANGTVLDVDVLPILGSGAYDALAMLDGRVYVQDYQADALYIFDPLSDMVIGTQQVFANINGGLAGAENPTELIGIAGANGVRINPANGQVTNGFNLDSPAYLGVASSADRLYFGSAVSSQILVTDRAGVFVATLNTPYPFTALAGDDYHAERLTNGGFEQSFTDWTKSSQSGSFGTGFQIYSAANPAGSGLPAPPAGTSAAFSGDMSSGPGAYFLYRDITLPEAQSHDLSFTVFYNNAAPGFVASGSLSFQVGPNQQMRIDIVRPAAGITSTAAGDVLANLFRTDQGEPNSLAPTALTADLSPFAGQTVRLRIAVSANQAPLWMGIDAVRLVSRTSGLRETPPAIYTSHADGARLGTVSPQTGLGVDRGAFGIQRTYAQAFDNVSGALYAIVNTFGAATLATVNLTTGVATPIGSGLQHEVDSLEIDNAGRLFGVGAPDGVLYQIDRTTGVATAIGGTGQTGWADLAINSVGELFGVANNQLWKINVSTAAITPVGSIGPVAASVKGLAFDATDTLYVTTYQPNSPLYTFNTQTLVTTLIGSTGLDFAVGGDILIPYAPTPSPTVGVATDVAGRRLLIFDGVTGAQTGVVSLPAATSLGDVILSPDGVWAYAADANNGCVWIVNVPANSIASGINNIAVGNPANDLSLTPDGKFLLVASPAGSISVVDTTTRTVVSTFSASGFTGVEVVANDQVLLNHLGTDTVAPLSLSAAGVLTPVPAPVSGGGMNVTLAPDGATVVAISSSAHLLTSFSASGLVLRDQESVPEQIFSLAFSPDGTKLYVRGSNEVLGYLYNPTTGAIGSRIFTTPLNDPAGFLPGMDRVDVSNDGLRVYVSGSENVFALNASTGAILGGTFLVNGVISGVDLLPTTEPEPPVEPDPIGVAVDNSSNRVLIFNPETGVQIGLVDVPGSGMLDVVVSRDLAFAYVSDVQQQAVWVIDLATKALAGGVNPIPMGMTPFDLALTANGEFLIATSSPGSGPVVVVNTAAHAIASTLSVSDILSVEVIGNDQVLLGRGFQNVVEHFTLSAAGGLTPSQKPLAPGGAFNQTAAPDGKSVVGINPSRTTLTTFLLPSMISTQTLNPGGELVSAVFNAAGTRIYLRTTFGVAAYAYDPVTATIGAEFYLTPLSNFLGAPVGVDQLDLSPDGAKLYVSRGDRVAVLDTATGAETSGLDAAPANFAGVDVQAPVAEPPVETPATLGVAIDKAGRKVLIFDAATDAQLALVPIATANTLLDVVMSPDLAFAYVSDFDGQRVWVVDLNTRALATGVNPIPVGMPVFDLDLTADGKFLVAATPSNPVQVIDTTTRAIASTFLYGAINSVEVIGNDTVLISHGLSNNVEKFTISSAGTIGPPSQNLNTNGGGFNITAAPNGVTAVGIGSARDTVTSFNIGSMSALAGINPGIELVAAAFHPDGTKLYVRSTSGVLAYAYNPASGLFGAQLFNIPLVNPTGAPYGVDQLEVSPDGSKLYVTTSDRVAILNPTNGAIVAEITSTSGMFAGIDVQSAPIEAPEDLPGIGAAVDNQGRRVLIFDPVTNNQLGAVSLPDAQNLMDVVLSPDSLYAYVSDYAAQRIWVIDVAHQTLAAGTNPIQLSLPVFDLDLTANGRYLLAAGPPNGVTTIDTMTRSVVSSTPNDAYFGVETLGDDQVLLTRYNSDIVEKYTLSAGGVVGPPQGFVNGGGFNVVAAPDGATAVAINSNRNTLVSLTIAGMQSVSSVPLGEETVAIAFNTAGTRLFVRTSNGVRGFGYTPASGAIGAQIFNVSLLNTLSGPPGIDYLDVSPDGLKLFVASMNRVAVLSAADGALLAELPLTTSTFAGVDVGGPIRHLEADLGTIGGGNVGVSLSGGFEVAGLNLYDYRLAGGQFALGAADVRLVGAAVGAISGSLILGADGTSFVFAATNRVLPPDTYTLTVRSAADGFRSASGELLDGDGDGIAGGDWVTTFVVAAPLANRVTVSLPSFSRGPQQAVNVPAASSLGLPLAVSEAGQVRFLAAEVRFDPGLLNVTGVTLPPDAPPGSTANYTALGAGHGRITLTFGGPWLAGARTIAYLQADVPAAAASRYGERELIDLSALDLRDLNNFALASVDQDAVHVNAYSGDAGRNGRYDSFDVQQASRMALRLDTGFQQHLLLDPAILADFNGNGRVDSFDVQQLSRLALRLPITGAPALPSPLPTVENTGRLVAEDSPEKTSLRSDVDGNGAVDAQDVLWAIYYYERSEPQRQADINRDGVVDPADILLAITDFQKAISEGESADNAPADSEEYDALAYLLAHDLVATKKKR